MNPKELVDRIDNCAKSIESFVSEKYNESMSDEEIAEMKRAALRMTQICALLPARGPAASHSCPHCSKNLKVSIS